MNPVIWYSLGQSSNGGAVLSIAELVFIIILAAYIAYIIFVLIERSVCKDMVELLYYKSFINKYPLSNRKYFLKCLIIPFYYWVVELIKLFKDDD